MATTLRLIPPREATRGAVVVLIPLVAAAALAGWWAGVTAVLGVVLGFAAGVQPAITDTGRPLRATAGMLAVAAAVGGLAAAGHAWWAALAVGTTALAGGALNLRANSLGVMLPAVAATCASTGLADQPWRLAVSTAAGFALIALLAAAMRVSLPARPVEPAAAWRHATVLAGASGLATALFIVRDVSHGYWLVVTLCAALRPVAGETWRSAVDRTVGTVLGALAAAVMVLVLPTGASLFAAAACAVLMLAWAVAGNLRMQSLYLTPVIVLLGSSGLAGSGVSLALGRAVLTLGGAAVAIGLALLLHWSDNRVEGTTASSA